MPSLAKIMTLSLISITLLLATALRSSSARKHKSDDNDEKDLRDLCSDTSDSRLCWDIIKSNFDSFNQDYRSLTASALDLATRKGNEIKDLLHQDHHGSNDDKLKEKYKSCAKDYNDAIHDLDQGKNRLDSNDYSKILGRVHDALKELGECRNEFDNDSFDPGHIRDRNAEFLVYVEIVKISANRLVKEDHN